MSHTAQINFIAKIKEIFPKQFSSQKALEVGALDINGTIRTFFKDCDYTGIDLELGKGVDLAVQGQLMDFKTHSFDVAISCNCFEHNPFWLETFVNMLRVTKLGGIVIFTCGGYGFKEHGTTRTSPADSPFTMNSGWNYYRNLTQRDFEKSMDLSLWFDKYLFVHNYKSKDLFFIGITKGSAQLSTNLDNLTKHFAKYNRIYTFICNYFGSPMDWLYINRKILKAKIRKFKKRLKDTN